MIGTTLTQFLIEEQRRISSATGDLTSVINDIVTACKAITSAMRYGALSDEDLLGVSSNDNVQGETQKTLDIIANELFLRRTEFGGNVAGMVSEEMENIYHLPDHYTRGRYLLLYDPVDGSSNISENASIGTIFSILKRAPGASGQPTLDEFLQPGAQQVCAGYAIYGPSSMIVLTTGNGVNGFTLDPLVGEYIISHPDIVIPEDYPRFYINTSFAHCWDEPIQRYISDCMDGEKGPLGRECDHRWSAGAVADVHRLLLVGGIYMSPVHEKLREQGLPGKLRLLYEVNPLSFLVEQAGGLATTGDESPLNLQPEGIHQRCPIILGSRNEVNRLLSNYLGQPEIV
jgi:fructose-1,6-bisphosphatase I